MIFKDKRAGAGLVSCLFILGTAKAREHGNARIRVLSTDQPRSRKPVHRWHRNVHDRPVRLKLREKLDGRMAIGTIADFGSQGGAEFPQECAHVAVVVHDQNFHCERAEQVEKNLPIPGSG